MFQKDVCRNGSATTRSLPGRVAKAERVFLSLDTFQRAVQFGPASHFAHIQMVSACAGRGALLRAPGVLVGQRYCFGIFDILKDSGFDPVLTIFATERVAKVEWDARLDLDGFFYSFEERKISVIPASTALRSIRTAGEGIEEGGIRIGRPKYHGDFASRGMPKVYARKIWGRFSVATNI